jgi:hypothetical protein
MRIGELYGTMKFAGDRAAVDANASCGERRGVCVRDE